MLKNVEETIAGIINKIENSDGSFSISNIEDKDFLIFNKIKGLSDKKYIKFNGLFNHDFKIEARLNSPDGKLIGILIGEMIGTNIRKI